MDWKARSVRIWPGHFRGSHLDGTVEARASCIERPEVGTDIRKNGSSEALHPSRALEKGAIADVGANSGSSLLAAPTGSSFSESNLPNVRVSVPTLCL